MEYCPNGNLEEVITLAGGPMDEEQIIRWVFDLANALERLHDKCIINADVKSANVVVTERNEARLLDFGASVEVESISAKAIGFFGTQEYDPPEVVLQKCDPITMQFTHKVDIWGLGCIMYEMMTGQLLTVVLAEIPLSELMRNIPEEYSTFSKRLLEWLLDPHPDRRASADQALQYLINPKACKEIETKRMSRTHFLESSIEKSLQELTLEREPSPELMIQKPKPVRAVVSKRQVSASRMITRSAAKRLAKM